MLQRVKGLKRNFLSPVAKGVQISGRIDCRIFCQENGVQAFVGAKKKWP